MNPRIQKLSTEIDNTTARIAHLQTRLKELEQQRGELENTEIIETVRSVTATPEELAAFIKAFRANAGATLPEHVLSGRVVSDRDEVAKGFKQSGSSHDFDGSENGESENEKEDPEDE